MRVLLSWAGGLINATLASSGPRDIAMLMRPRLLNAASLLLLPRLANSFQFPFPLLVVPPLPIADPSDLSRRPLLVRTHPNPSSRCRPRRRRKFFVVTSSSSPKTVLRGSGNNDDGDLHDKDRSRGGGTGEAVGGAILGCLLGGPFGALFGAQIGRSFGAASTLDRAREEEMKPRGLTPDMLESTTDIGVALSQAMEGLSAIRKSVETSQSLARNLDVQEKSLYDRAMSAIACDEESARRLLLERESIEKKLLKVLTLASEDRKRIAIMEGNVKALETRGLEIESLLRRSVGASSLRDTADIGLGISLAPEDPLLRKFCDLGM
jgi:hypothetical protein